MISSEQIEEVLPCPIKVEICCDSEEFRIAVKDSFKKLLDKHNKNYETKIEHLARHYVDSEEDMEENECRVFIGKEPVHIIKGLVLFEDDTQKLQEYYKSIVNITESVLTTWHNKIIEIQKENEEKLEHFKEEEYDEMLYGYYLIRGDNRAFQYLKKLAIRYPNSKYMNKLKRVYRNGLYGWHQRDNALARKLNNRRDNHEAF